ncbi:hypothetical protein QUV83_03290 [Cellulomonas cellasea]|uniref:hypothetical protein n=1 Tax=Cellulomonas cellasea TaxID=43670 RepID=UPI0025A4A7F8|nr:hypothetical protein [Cellulomonas cellasea]MDM8083789.1 hypothetical protein [Cellulomonas cellasea]
MSPTPQRARRVSKAQALRHREALAAQASAHRDLSPQAVRIIATFDITRYGTTTQPVRPFLTDAITRSRLTGLESIRKHCRHLTALAVFSDAQGLPLRVEVVLTTDNIDDYIRRGMHAESRDNRAERRRRLLWVAQSANPGPTVPARLAPVGYQAVKAPYTPDERATILRAARTQPTERGGQQLAAVVALGFGAGADSIDLRELWIHDITDHGLDGLTVAFHGSRPRIVPVRRVVEDLLRQAIAGRAPDELVIGQEVTRRNTAARVIAHAALYKVPHIEPARMRATWLADLMTDTVPLAVILQAAGLKSARTLTDVLPHTSAWLQAKTIPGTTLVRGGAK